MKLSDRLPSFSSFFSGLIILFFVYIFFSGDLLKFYASLVFGFYALTNKMWVSVILLGVAQTILLIPLRIIKLIRNHHIREFEEKFEDQTNLNQNSISELKTLSHQGNRDFFLYLIDFIIQLTTFLTIGRLFLTDFYIQKLKPELLYNFIPYPEYPIQSRIFYLPYPNITKTTNLGFFAIIIVWLIIYFLYKLKVKFSFSSQAEKSALWRQGSILIFFLASYFLLTHFPQEIKLGIFTGDVGIPNRTLNSITAIVTFLTLFYFGLNRIERKTELARNAGISQTLINQIEQQMFNQSIRDSALVGLAAYFITNQIPSAFELSIFTLEIISLASPFTLDRFILKTLSRLNQSTENNQQLT